MALTRINYTGDGSTTAYTFDFPYNSTSEIRVLLNGTLLEEETDYNFTDEFTIEMVAAPAADDFLIIRRALDFTQRPDGLSWNDTSRLTSADHNKEDNYDLWRSQENYDNRGIPRSLTRDAWDAQDNQDDETPVTVKIGNVGYPQLLDDAATKRYVEDRLTGQQAGLAGAFRMDPETYGDGVTTDFTFIDSGDGVIPQGRNDMVQVTFDGRLIPYSDYTISSNGRGITFVLPPGNGILIDAWVLTAALAEFTDGTIGPGKIALTEDLMILGNSDNVGEETALSDVSLSSWGVPTGNLSMNSKKITSLATPTNNGDAANKAYVDGLVAAVDPFGSVVSGNAYTISTVIENQSGATQLVNMQIVVAANISAGKTYELQYADNAGMTTNLKTVAIYNITSLGARESSTIMAIIPADKFWRLHITSGSHSSSITFAYQITGVA